MSSESLLSSLETNGSAMLIYNLTNFIEPRESERESASKKKKRKFHGRKKWREIKYNVKSATLHI